MQRSELIILAIPVDALLKIMPSIMDNAAPNHVIMDVGSTKEKILELVAGHPRRGRFVAAHPMAGTEYSGPEAAVRLREWKVLADEWSPTDQLHARKRF